MTHAILSASASHRWLACPGSIALSQGLPDTAGASAREGTAMHEVAAWCLTDGADAAAYIGRVIEVDGHKIEFTADMAELVQVYLDTVRGLVETTGGTLLVEQKVDYSAVLGVQDSFGTADAIILADGTLYIIDLKTGQNEVEAENNTQLQLYALGALEDFGLVSDFETAVLMISQPTKRREPSSWEISVDDLNAFGRKAATAAQCAASLIYTSADAEPVPEAYLVPGDEQCKYCKAKATCPALRRHVSDTVFEDFDALDSTDPLPAPASPVTPDTLAVVYAKLDLIEQWVKAMRERAYTHALAGGDLPGFKLVAGKRGARAWTDEEQAEATLKSMRLKQDEMFTFKLISPTAAEKLLKDQPKRWAKVSTLIKQSEGKPVLAPETDKRPALRMAPVSDEFGNLDSDASDLL
jgi:hypothetical protein